MNKQKPIYLLGYYAMSNLKKKLIKTSKFTPEKFEKKFLFSYFW